MAIKRCLLQSAGFLVGLVWLFGGLFFGFCLVFFILGFFLFSGFWVFLGFFFYED